MNSRSGAAMLLLFDIAAEAIEEHDDWHTHEHLPERLAIPGFLRGSRWIAQGGSPRYFVMYEVRELACLGSEHYLERLNNPTPWTSKMMAHYRGMRRGLCNVVAGFGAGLGSTALLIRFAAAAEHADPLRDWLAGELLPGLVKRRGIADARLLAPSLEAVMTREQEIRGQDAGIQSALLVTGYESEAVAALAKGELHGDHFMAHGALAEQHESGVFRNVVALTAWDALKSEPT
jgi:hypothetical protein